MMNSSRTRHFSSAGSALTAPSSLEACLQRAEPGLAELPLVQRGSRLSVMPVSDEHWQIILAMR